MKKYKTNYLKTASIRMNKLICMNEDRKIKRLLEKIYDAIFISSKKIFPELEQIEKRINDDVQGLEEVIVLGNKKAVKIMVFSLLKIIKERNRELKKINRKLKKINRKRKVRQALSSVKL